MWPIQKYDNNRCNDVNGIIEVINNCTIKVHVGSYLSVSTFETFFGQNLINSLNLVPAVQRCILSGLFTNYWKNQIKTFIITMCGKTGSPMSLSQLKSAT